MPQNWPDQESNPGLFRERQRCYFIIISYYVTFYIIIQWNIIIIIIIIIIRMFCPRVGLSLQAPVPRLLFCRRQVFCLKLRNQGCSGCSFTRDWISTVASRCSPHPTLSLATGQTLKDARGTNVEVRRMVSANWTLRTSPNEISWNINKHTVFIL